MAAKTKANAMSAQQMNPIYEIALRSTGVDEKVINIIKALDEKEQTGAIKYLLGIIDINPNLPNIGFINNHFCELNRYEWLKDEVNYSYTYTDKRYFKTQEDAEKYTNGKWVYDNTTTKRDEYTIAAEREETAHGCCTLEQWWNAVEELSLHIEEEELAF